MRKIAVLLAASMLSGCMISAGPARPGSDCGQLGCLSQPDKSQERQTSLEYPALSHVGGA